MRCLIWRYAWNLCVWMLYDEQNTTSNYHERWLRHSTKSIESPAMRHAQAGGEGEMRGKTTHAPVVQTHRFAPGEIRPYIACLFYGLHDNAFRNCDALSPSTTSCIRITSHTSILVMITSDYERRLMVSEDLCAVQSQPERMEIMMSMQNGAESLSPAKLDTHTLPVESALTNMFDSNCVATVRQSRPHIAMHTLKRFMVHFTYLLDSPNMFTFTTPMIILQNVNIILAACNNCTLALCGCCAILQHIRYAHISIDGKRNNQLSLSTMIRYCIERHRPFFHINNRNVLLAGMIL